MTNTASSYQRNWYVSMGERFLNADTVAEGNQLSRVGTPLSAPADQYLCLFYTHPTYGILEISEYNDGDAYNFVNYTRQTIGEWDFNTSGNTLILSNKNSVTFNHTDSAAWPTITHIGVTGQTLYYTNSFLTTGNTIADDYVIPDVTAISPVSVALAGNIHFGRGNIRIQW